MDGELIISSDYDQHGYSGMEAIEKTIKAIARKLGTSLKEIEPEDQ